MAAAGGAVVAARLLAGWKATDAVARASNTHVWIMVLIPDELRMMLDGPRCVKINGENGNRYLGAR